MLKIDRHKLIEEELRLYGSIMIPDISRKVGCTEETIRRDLKEMEAQNKLKRIHGGAFLPADEDRGAPVHLKEGMLPKEKGMLASYAVKNLIRENDTLMLDSSSTCFTLAQHIFAANKKVTIITNSLRIFDLFDRASCPVTLIAVGGFFRHHSNSFVGHDTTSAIANYVADKCFISCSAVDITHGLVDNSSHECQIRKTYIRQSREHYLIADHTKFSDKADYIIEPLNRIDLIVTDKKLSAAWEEVLQAGNIPVRYC